MPKDGSHIGYSLFPSVCSDSCFIEILTFDVLFFSMQRMLYDCDKTLQLQTNDLDVDTMYEIRVKEGVLFISIVTNSRYKSFLIPIFDRFLEKFFKRLETRNSKLEPRNSILDSRKHRVSRIEFRVETVNLHLTGTVL